MKKLHLPRETFLPLFQVSFQHRLQLLLQDAEGLPGGQAQGQGWLALEGSRRLSASPWRPQVPAKMGLSTLISPGPSSLLLKPHLLSTTGPGPSGCSSTQFLMFKATFNTKTDTNFLYSAFSNSPSLTSQLHAISLSQPHSESSHH